jgi:hypothetical protein
MRKGILLLLIILGSACQEKIKFSSEIPKINYQKFDTDNAILEFEFIDGNGDLGLSQGDTFPPFDTSSFYYYNLFVSLMKKIDSNEYEKYDPPIPSNYRFERLEQPVGNNKTVKGTFELKMKDALAGAPLDSFYIRFFMVDRALNHSNIDSTELLYLDDIFN